MKFSTLIVVSLMVVAPLTSASDLNLGITAASASFDSTCDHVLRTGGDVRSSSMRRYGPLDANAISNFCELFEASSSLLSVSDAVSESCIDAAKLSADSTLKTNAQAAGVTENYKLDDSAGREAQKYDGDVVDPATLEGSLKNGFDHLNRELNAGISKNANAFTDGVAAVFDCTTPIQAQQNALENSLKSSGVILHNDYINGLKESIRDLYAAKAARAWVKTLIAESEADLENSISRSSEAALLGKATSESARKVVEGIAKQLETIRDWESGKASPSGEAPEKVSKAILDGIKELTAQAENLKARAAHHQVELRKKTYELAMLNKVAASSEQIVEKYEAHRERNAQKAIITGYNSYQKLADAGATHE
jgi:hypothetical protein